MIRSDHKSKASMTSASYNSNRCVFVGNIPEFWVADDLISLFSPYGQVLDASIKLSPETGRTACYGFVKFNTAISAAIAIRELNRKFLCGRSLRVGQVINKKADDASTTVQGYLNIPSVHVSFISYQIDKLVTPESLWKLFSSYGDVKYVSIKKNTIDDSGFGFIHYSLNPTGIQSSFIACRTLYDECIDDVIYTCKISHALEKYISVNKIDLSDPRSISSSTLNKEKASDSSQSSSFKSSSDNNNEVKTDPISEGISTLSTDGDYLSIKPQYPEKIIKKIPGIPLPSSNINTGLSNNYNYQNNIMMSPVPSHYSYNYNNVYQSPIMYSPVHIPFQMPMQMSIPVPNMSFMNPTQQYLLPLTHSLSLSQSGSMDSYDNNNMYSIPVINTDSNDTWDVRSPPPSRNISYNNNNNNNSNYTSPGIGINDGPNYSNLKPSLSFPNVPNSKSPPIRSSPTSKLSIVKPPPIPNYNRDNNIKLQIDPDDVNSTVYTSDSVEKSIIIEKKDRRRNSVNSNNSSVISTLTPTKKKDISTQNSSNANSIDTPSSLSSGDRSGLDASMTSLITQNSNLDDVAKISIINDKEVQNIKNIKLDKYKVEVDKKVHRRMRSI